MVDMTSVKKDNPGSASQRKCADNRKYSSNKAKKKL